MNGADAAASRTLIVLAVLLLSACGRFGELPTAPPDPTQPDPTATFTRVQTTVFSRSCALAGCHDAVGANFSAGLELTPGRAYANLVGRPSTQIPTLLRVAPSSPENSYLMRKITGTQPLIGGRMPLNAQPLSEEEIALVRDWIRRDAPND